MKLAIFAAAFAALAMAAPITKRQCFFDENNNQICDPTVECTPEGTIPRVCKRDPTATPSKMLSKRQCYIEDNFPHCNEYPPQFVPNHPVKGEKGQEKKQEQQQEQEQQRNDNDNNNENNDQDKIDANVVIEKRQCQFTEAGVRVCNTVPVCKPDCDGNMVCVM